jgi:hypothetical protein
MERPAPGEIETPTLETYEGSATRKFKTVSKAAPAAEPVAG